MQELSKVKSVKSPLQLRLQEFHESIDRFKGNPSVSLLQEVEDIWICIYDILEEEVIEYTEDDRSDWMDNGYVSRLEWERYQREIYID